MAGPFAQITSGPANPTAVNTNKESLIFDRTSGIVESVRDDGAMQGLQAALKILPAQTALTTVTTAQNLMVVPLGGIGFLNKLGRTLLISGYGIFTTAGVPQITIAIVIGGVTVCSIQTPAIGAAQTNGQFQFSIQLSVVSTGASGTIEAHGTISVQGGATLAAAVPAYADQNTAPSSAINLTATNTVTATIAATVSLSSAQLRLASVEVLN